MQRRFLVLMRMKQLSLHQWMAPKMRAAISSISTMIKKLFMCFKVTYLTALREVLVKRNGMH
ncbi:hypothetical protein RM61_11535 [Xanthomonas phaseoli pv. phaseoli]|nr:hypothetical protein AB890_00460 [Xanthomonas citri pv. citri]KHS07182.1 hypothetical protein RM61_11535 [Xanthomonas phaseoli pv. phaseoli]OOW63733.1 hypothetical protein Xths_11670 [Xanthomonas campestris pv. thespesiae]OOW82187.1 hypothetical protein Xlen_07690 [Xanthomonas campestris pv. leeana]OOW56149.1 hypothetical protein BFQ41_22175 [Xanthomonas citri pv. citri]